MTNNGEIGDYTPVYVARLFGRSASTIRMWADTFKQHLSAGANPHDNRHRRYTAEDLEVLALVAEMTTSGHSYDDIAATLATGERGELPDLPEVLPEGGYKAQHLAIALQQSTNRIQQLEAEVQELSEHKEEVIKLRALMEYVQQQQDLAQLDAAEARQTIRELEREIGKLQATIEQLKKE